MKEEIKPATMAAASCWASQDIQAIMSDTGREDKTGPVANVRWWNVSNQVCLKGCSGKLTASVLLRERLTGAH